MKIIDISMPLHNKTAGWPGDTPFTFEVNWTKEQTGSVNVGKLEMSTHIGTHIDAPFHYDNEGKRVLQLELDRYIGKARVVDVSGKQQITPDDLLSVDLEEVERVLFKTKSWKDRTVFPENITYLSPNLPSFLAEKGVKLIGVDVPSVDPLDSKDLQAHHQLLANDIHILEGIVLDDVDEGIYELVALPLPLQDADGSPVRAILKTE
ncbi:arylformamidase [Bacillus timonensis]|nr:arylformamidase [Bacillus timonensis]